MKPTKSEKQLNNCNRCGKTAHHTHHKDGNHKNNKPDNRERLCTLCHSKEHGTEPRIGELRKLVTFYERAQKAKVTLGLVVKSFKRIEIDAPKELIEETERLEKIENKFEKTLKVYWKTNSNAQYEYLVAIRGISDVLASKLIARIDLSRTPSEASLWAYAGYTPNSHKGKGKKANWNQALKHDCYQLVDCFIKARTPEYREVYDREKEKQLELGIERGHAHNRAIRKTAKRFLRDYFRAFGGQEKHVRQDHPPLAPVIAPLAFMKANL